MAYEQLLVLDQNKELLKEQKQEQDKIKELEGIRSKSLAEKAKYQLIRFNRILKEKELEVIRNYLAKLQKIEKKLEKEEVKKDEIPSKERQKNATDFIMTANELKKYLKENKLEARTKQIDKEKRTIIFSLPKNQQARKELQNSLALNADGDMGDQENEMIMIEGRMSPGDIEKIKNFQKQLRELDQRMDTNEQEATEHCIEQKEGLLNEYRMCLENMSGYVRTNIRGGNIQSKPQKEIQSLLSKTQADQKKAKEKENEHKESIQKSIKLTRGARTK